MNTQKLINHEREIFNKKKSEKKRNFTEKNQSFTQKKHILRQIKKNKEKFQETCWARMTGEDEDDDKDEEATESEFPLRGSTAVPWVDLKNENLGLAVKDETAWNETKPSIFFFRYQILSKNTNQFSFWFWVYGCDTGSGFMASYPFLKEAK